MFSILPIDILFKQDSNNIPKNTCYKVIKVKEGVSVFKTATHTRTSMQLYL
jgi:hypothetical protein